MSAKNVEAVADMVQKGYQSADSAAEELNEVKQPNTPAIKFEAEGTLDDPIVINNSVPVPALKDPGKRRGLASMVSDCLCGRLIYADIL
jgi:hypothetical protein